MQRLIVYSFFLPAFFFFSCSNNKEKSTPSDQDVPGKHSLSDPQLQQMMDNLNDSSEVNMADGFHELKYPNGNLKSTGTISNGKKEGVWTYYREDGTKWSECQFLNDAAHGKVVSYHKNGQVNYIGYFTNGEKSGVYMFYDENGKLLKEVNVSK